MERPQPFSHELITFIERGIPFAQLESRLRPATENQDSGSYKKDVERHDGFGDFSKEGFLGQTESLLAVISTDLETVRKYNTTHTAIASAISNTIPIYDNVSRKNMFQISTLNPNYEYIPPMGGTLGEQKCPWECNMSGQNAGIIVRKGISDIDRFEAEFSQMGLSVEHLIDLFKGTAATKVVERLLKIKENRQKTREVFYVPLTGLLPHLIEAHLFFEGRESPFRADPEFLIKAFDLNGK